MVPVNFKTALALTGLCLFFTPVEMNASQNKNCSCSGPTNYYKELGCEPVFRNSDDCCPVRYDCGVLSNLTDSQCLINGHVYESGKLLRDEDKNPCDGHCICKNSSFLCAMALRAIPRPEKPCRWINTDINCNGGRIICPKQDGSFATCIVEGKTYSDGDLFVPLGEPEKRCYCGEGYTGANVAPFCGTSKHSWCNNVMWGGPQIRKCAPAYRLGASPQNDCNAGFRCPADTDVVIKRTNKIANESKDGTSETADLHMSCKFGKLTIEVGEELNQDTERCAKCICEVPPILTCTETMTREECKASRHH